MTPTIALRNTDGPAPLAIHGQSICPYDTFTSGATDD